ncbi:MAG: hypothetical protein ACR2OZ_13525 [Verrucomicrobiales bacterium]
MKDLRLLLALTGLFICEGSLWAATTVNLGTVSPVAGPGSLDLAGDILYAIHFGPNNPSTLTVNGVPFLSDTAPPPGASFVGPNSVPFPGWQTKPEFGGSADDNALEDIYQDIRWANNALGETLQANLDVVAGEPYRLQLLFYGNHAVDDRRWDIVVDGAQAVDQVVSLGVSNFGELPPYSPNQGLVYTYDFLAPDNQVNVVMGQLFGITEGADLNPIWQGLTLERIPEPAALALGSFGLIALLRRRRRFDRGA